MTRSAAGRRGGQSAASNRRTRTPRSASERAAARPSAPLLPLPAMTLTVRPYVPPSIWRAMPGDGRPGPLDEHLDRLGRGRIDRRHLVRRDDRDHGPPPPRPVGVRRLTVSDDRRSLGDDHRHGDRAVVADRQVPAHDAAVDGQLPGPAGDDQPGRPGLLDLDPHLVEPERAEARGRAPSSPPPGRRSGRPATAPGRPWARRTPARPA